MPEKPASLFKRFFVGFKTQFSQILRAEQHSISTQYTGGYRDKADSGGWDRLQNHADDYRYKYKDGEVTPGCGSRPSGIGINNRIASTANGAIAFQIFS